MSQANSDRYNAALEYLLSRIDYERAAVVPYDRREFYLDRMHDLLGRLGNPHHKLKVVHVAGTKGKGSTAAMIAAVLSAAGYRTGLYTSPHLDRLEERFAIDGRICTADELTDLVERVRGVVMELDAVGSARNPPELGPTYFDVTTA